MLKALKYTALRAAAFSGISATVRDSSWRNARLLILGYHGVSLNDEHEWDPGLYVNQSFLRRRFEALRDGGFAVLSLDEGIRRLKEGTLPAKAVSLTFDDGTSDFVPGALPLLKEFGFPATVYLTTFYCLHQFPVFDTMCRYLLWMGRDRDLDGTLLGLAPGTVSLASPANRTRVFRDLRRLAYERGYSWSAKDELLGQLARHLDIDYSLLCARRTMFVMSPDEVASLPDDLIDVQLHTHRHRLPLERARTLQELDENRRVIRTLKPDASLRHFCYPSGITQLPALAWLREAGVMSATTCELGLASAKDDPLLLPRLIDSHLVSEVVYESWLDGIGTFLPRRPAISVDI